MQLASTPNQPYAESWCLSVFPRTEIQSVAYWVIPPARLIGEVPPCSYRPSNPTAFPSS